MFQKNEVHLNKVLQYQVSVLVTVPFRYNVGMGLFVLPTYGMPLVPSIVLLQLQHSMLEWGVKW